MRMPRFLPPVSASSGRAPAFSGRAREGLELQGCSTWKKIGCGAAIAGCIATGAGVVPCLLKVAPGCVDCVLK